MSHSKERVGGHSEDLRFFPFAHENCLHFKVAPVMDDKKASKAPCCDRSSPCNTMNLRSSESSPQIAPLDETIKEMCWNRWKSMEKLGLPLHRKSFINYSVYISSDFVIVDVSLHKIPKLPLNINLRVATIFFTAPCSPEILIV